MAAISSRDNIHTEMDGTVLVIKIETDESKVVLQPSGSGKTLVIATTGGARHMDGRSLNLTLYRKP